MMGTPDSYMPERAGIKYHVITMEWFNQWKQYVGFDTSSEEESKEASKY